MAKKSHRLERVQRLDVPLDTVFQFFSDASNLEAITPRFLKFHILTPTPIAMQVGARIDYTLSLFGLPVRWRTLISVWEPGRSFVDEQESGPFALWRHRHEFEDHSSYVLMRDVVDYQEPLGSLGQIAHILFVRALLERVFDFRRDAISSLMGGPAQHDEAVAA